MTHELEHTFVISPLSGEDATSATTLAPAPRTAGAHDVVRGRLSRGPLGAVEVEVVVDGWRFVYLVESKARADLRKRAVRAGTAGGVSGAAEVRAMIPGRVVAVSVAADDVVRAGQPLLTVEAMKMQNEVRAPADGVVASVAVAVGDRVEQADLLVTFRTSAPSASAASSSSAEKQPSPE